MAKKPRRSPKVRAAPRRRPSTRVAEANFAARATAALKRGEPDAIPDELLRKTLAAAVKIYAAKAESRGEFAPYRAGEVTATETVVAASGLIRAADLNLFDVAMW